MDRIEIKEKTNLGEIENKKNENCHMKHIFTYGFFAIFMPSKSTEIF